MRAVFKPELRFYRDVVVFSSIGETSLASKLSGSDVLAIYSLYQADKSLSGDYDGDTAWICWDPAIVDPFKNASVPELPPLESYGIKKDTTKVSDFLPSGDFTNKFLRHAFQFNLQMSMLGICSNYHESLCYHTDRIDSPEAISIGMLLGYLVDGPKGGFIFDEPSWFSYLKQLGLPPTLEPPAYKDRNKAREKEGNLIDKLVFHVAKGERERALKNFTDRFEDVSPWDEDLVHLAREEMEEAKTNKALAIVLRNLKEGLEKILVYWKKRARREDDDDELLPVKRGSVLSFRTVVEKCREDFLALHPTIERSDMCDTSDTIRRWQQDHSMGRASHWDLIKASTAFLRYYKSVSFIWHTAGVELAEIKATKGNRGTYRCVVNPIHRNFKLDRKLIEAGKRKEMQLEELRKAQGSDEDDFGSDVDMTDL